MRNDEGLTQSLGSGNGEVVGRSESHGELRRSNSKHMFHLQCPSATEESTSLSAQNQSNIN